MGYRCEVLFAFYCCLLISDSSRSRTRGGSGMPNESVNACTVTRLNGWEFNGVAVFAMAFTEV